MSQIKFDVTGTLDGAVVAVGCQRVRLADAVKAADKVEIEGTMVRATGVVCEVDASGDITLPNGQRVSRPTLREQARNITDVTPPAPPQPEWQDGDVVWLRYGRSDQVLVYRINGRWYTLRNFQHDTGTDANVHTTNRWADDDSWTEADYYGCKPVIKGGKPVGEGTHARGPHEFRVGDITRTSMGTYEVTRIEGTGPHATIHRSNGMNNRADRNTLVTAVEDRT
jgi:hypothetical protein